MNITIEFKKILKRFGLEWFDRYYSSYRGFVVDNADPEFLGRLKLKIPQIYGENVPDYWAWPKGMFAGKQIGLFAIPNIDDCIWVSFENGDARYPIWEYGWFSEEDIPSVAKVDGNKPKNMVWQSSSNHRIELNDHDNTIRITDKHQNKIELNENGVSIITEKINLGTLNESAEPAVLGDTIESFLKEFIRDVGNVGTIVTSTGVTSTINTSPQWASLVSKWNSKWEKFKSDKVTLD